MPPLYEPPSTFPSGAPMETLFYISSRVPSNEVPPPGSPHRALSETPHPWSPLHPSLKVPGKWAPFQVPPWGPYGKRIPSPQLFLHHLQGPQERIPPPGSPHRVPIDRTAPFPFPNFNYLSEFPAKRTPLPCVPTGPLWTEVPISTPFYT